MYGLIYKITNLINGKVYIGQTTGTIEHRWSQHPSDSCCTHLYNSIKKYGRENFHIDQIDDADTFEELNIKEIYWIKFYSATNRSLGYNIKAGGYKGKHSEETKKKLSLQKLGSKNPQYGKKQSKETIEKRRQKMIGRTVSEKTKNKIKESNSQKLAVYCYQTNKTYLSISEAGRQLGLNSGYICRVLNGSRSHVHGYTFKYVNDSLNVPTKKNLTKEERSAVLTGRLMKNSKTIYCNNGGIYKSISKAAIACNIASYNISVVLSGKQKSTKGYIFSINPFSRDLIKTDVELKRVYESRKNRGLAKSIICNNTIIFQSIKAASKILNLGQNTIKRSIDKNKVVKSNFSFKFYIVTVILPPLNRLL